MGAFSLATWSHKVRYVGAGAIAVSAIWTLGKLVQAGRRRDCARRWSPRARARPARPRLLPRTEQDIPIGIVGLVSALCILPIGCAAGALHPASALSEHLVLLVRERRGLHRAS